MLSPLRNITACHVCAILFYDSLLVPIFPQCKMSNEGFKKSLTEVPIHPHILSYGVRESMAYIAGLLPITFGPILQSLAKEYLHLHYEIFSISGLDPALRYG